MFVALARLWETVERPGPYLHRSLVNTAVRQLRRHRRETPVSATDPPVARDGAVAPPVEPAGTSTVLARLGRLPPRQRAALVLRFYEDRSEADIADVLGCRPSTVRSLIHRGLHQLRKDLP